MWLCPFACLCMRLLCLCSVGILSLMYPPHVLWFTRCAKQSPLWTVYSIQIWRSCLVAGVWSWSLSWNKLEWETVGLVLVRAKGKMTFLCCLFWEGNRKNAGAAVLFLLADPTPVNSSLPLQRHSPYSRGGVWMYPSTVHVNNTSSGSSKLSWQ